MILVIGRKLNVSGGERHIGFEGDNLVETRHFKITDPSLFNMDFRADIGNTGETVYLEKNMTDENCIVVSMPITAAMVKNTPVLNYQLRAIEADGDRVWHSEKSYFYCNSSFDADKELSQQEIDQFHTLEKLAQQHCNDAEQMVNKCNADYDALKNDVYTKAQTDILLSGKAETNHNHTAADVGAYAKEETDLLLEGKAEKNHSHTAADVGAYSKKEVDFEIASIKFNIAGLPTFDDVYGKHYIDTQIGDIDSALDELHNYAQALIGGEA